jgi:circadian clock protein KaiC
MGQQSVAGVSFLSSGISGLDQILRGGFIRDRLYLIEGEPGSGKTTLALQFLLEGVRHGEPVLYITLSESRKEIEEVADSHGWTMDGIHVHEVLPPESILKPEEQYTIFHPSDVETAATTQDILAVIEAVRPTRVVLDSLSELQLLASSMLVYRRQILALRQFFTRRSCTALLLNDRTEDDGDLHTRSIAHGVVRLDRVATDYGGFRRRAEVIKYRGVEFREGLHDYKIRRGGLVVYPRLIAAESRDHIGRTHLRSGLDELDLLLGGGIEEGTSTLIIGPAGTGKSSLASQFAFAAIQRGQPAAIFLFEESASTFLHRADGLGFDFRTPLAAGLARLVQVDPAQLTPGEFIHEICQLVENGTKIIVLDSLNGFVHSMPSEKQLASHLHELLTYLAQRGVNTFLVAVQQGLLGETTQSDISASYIADNVIMLRYFEAVGEVHQAISVFKKRIGAHERTIRQMAITSSGIRIGPILRQFRGVLTGVPELIAPDRGKELDPHG